MVACLFIHQVTLYSVTLSIQRTDKPCLNATLNKIKSFFNFSNWRIPKKTASKSIAVSNTHICSECMVTTAGVVPLSPWDDLKSNSRTVSPKIVWAELLRSLIFYWKIITDGLLHYHSAGTKCLSLRPYHFEQVCGRQITIDVGRTIMSRPDRTVACISGLDSLGTKFCSHISSSSRNLWQ